MAFPEELYQTADELRAIAALGLQFAANEYDRERYARVMQTSTRLIAAIENRSSEEIYLQFRDNLSHISPLAGIEAVVFREGKLLLIQRRDDGLWALPGGLVEVGETLAHAAERELWEEANVRGRATQMLGIFDSRVCGRHAPKRNSTARSFASNQTLCPRQGLRHRTRVSSRRPICRNFRKDIICACRSFSNCNAVKLRRRTLMEFR